MLQSCKRIADNGEREAGTETSRSDAMKPTVTIALLSVGMLAAAPLGAGQRLAIRVSPAVAMAPASLTVRATIEPSERNRVLAIDIDSATYHRRSELPLDGKSAPRLNVVELKDVPSGLHEVRATLIGPEGTIASTVQLVKIEAAAGSAR